MAITKSNKHELSLDHDKPMRRVDAHFATLDLTNEGSLWDSQISITSLGPCSSWHSQTCFSAVRMSKSTPHTRVEVVFITWAEKRTVMCLCGVTGRSGQYTPNSSVYSVTGRWPASGHDFPSLEPYWSRPDAGTQRPIAHLSASGCTRRFHLDQMN